MPEGIMVASYRANGDAFEAAKPHLLVAMEDFGGFDLTPDGKRFAVVQRESTTDQKTDTHVTFLLNFFDELRARAGGRQIACCS